MSDGEATDSEDVTVTVTDSATAFVTMWQVAAGGSVTIPATGTYGIHWGDGVADAAVTGTQTHTYADAGNYAVAVSGGLTRINLGADPDNAAKLASIDQWGDMEWTTMEGAFQGAYNMAYRAADAPDLSGVTNMTGMFSGASAFDGNLSGWDVSRVTDMAGMFQFASDFNGNVSGWDVSGVTDMRDMFSGASDFNGNVSGWDVSGVTDMANMFGSARDFNADLSGWDVSRVTDMYGMFWGAAKFDSDLSGWNASGVTDMTNMFQSASAFKGNISGWDVSAVTGMSGMFWGAEKFNSDLSGWNVSGVTDMHRMFFNARAFNADLSGWNVSGVTDMFGMFYNAADFNADLSGWNVSGVTGMAGMFSGASDFNADLSGWDVSRVSDMTSMFQGAASFQQNLGTWYIVLNSTSINAADAPGVVGGISAQNRYLNDQTPTYAIGTGGDSGSFNITGGSDLNMNITSPAKSTYVVNVTSAGGFGDNNHRVLNVTVVGTDSNAPPVLDPIGPKSVEELQPLAFTATASDGDAGDALTFSLAGTVPVGASIDPDTGASPGHPGRTRAARTS